MGKRLQKLLHLFLLVLLGAAIVTATGLWYLQSHVGRLPKNSREIETGSFSESGEQSMGAESDIFHLLLIGQDKRDGDETGRSDAMILVSVNRERESIHLISFLRDLYVEIPRYENGRLNTAFALGGVQLLDETLEQNFGIHVDGNVTVDFSGFAAVIDALGGVEISLTAEEAAYMQENLDGTFTADAQHLSGEEALFYARIRYLDSDFFRTARQRNVLQSVLRRCRELPLTKIVDVIRAVLPRIATDLPVSELARQMVLNFPLLSGRIGELCIPADGTCYDATIDGMAVLVADKQANYDILRQAIYGLPEEE